MSPKLRRWPLALSAVFVLASVAPGAAAVRFVSPTGTDEANDCLGSADPCRTLANAVAESASGDTIELAKGRYAGPVTITGSPSITLTVEGGWSPDFTTRDLVHDKSVVKGGPQSFVFTLTASGTTAVDVTLDGLTITKGTWGGIEADALENGSVSLALSRCTLLANKGDGGFGGGVTMRARNASTVHVAVADSTFKGNRAGVKAFFGGAPGGGILVSGTTGTGSVTLDVTRSLFVGNVSRYDAGGAIAVFPGDLFDLHVSDSTFLKNRAAGSGGAIAFDGPNGGPFALDVTNSLFAGNRSLHADGGALALSAMNGSVRVTNCTLVGNAADTTGGGASIAFVPDATFTNTIAWGNRATSGQDVYVAATTLGLDHDDVADVATLSASVTDLGGNIDADPLLVHPPKDLHLSAASPCIDTGTCAGAPATDFEGDPRPSGAGCDIGADEFVP